MYLYYNKDNKNIARELRNNMTKEERKLWYLFLKKFNPKFLRQKPIDNYIADFYCAKSKLIIELDGGQHFTQEGIDYDKARTRILNKYHLRVIRLTNGDINYRFKEACELIMYEINKEDNNET